MTTEQTQPKYGVRIEYDLPPTRMIGSMWYEEDDQADDSVYIEAFKHSHPRAVIRKIERRVPLDTGRR